jgi:tRNA (mo5U34)-methyltransferase
MAPGNGWQRSAVPGRKIQEGTGMKTAALLTHPAAGTHGLAARAAELAPWFHNLHLPDGTQTAPNHPLGDFPAFKWREIAAHLPEDLRGWTALDIGCNAGFYAIELARRGAKVVAIDKDPHFLRQAHWAVPQFELEGRIEVRQGQVYDIARWSERFDLILFLGVFYHLRYPLLALDIVAEHVKRLLFFQTLTMPGEEVVDPPEDHDFHDRQTMLRPGWPKMAFIEKKLAGDPTNWWAPNHAGVEAMLRSAGLRPLARPGHEIYLAEPADTAAGRCVRKWDEEEIFAATGRPAPARDQMSHYDGYTPP